MALPRLRHIIYTLATVILMLTWRWPARPLKITDYLWPLLGLAVVLSLMEVVILFWTSHSIVRDLGKGDLERFLKRTDREIKTIPKGQWQSSYKINKTAGLYYLGKFDEALEILNTISPKKLNKLFQFLYVNNMLANLLGLERIKEAEVLLEKYPDYRKAGKLHKHFQSSIDANLGKLKFYQGEYQTARYLLTEALKDAETPLSSGVIHFHLGLLDQKEGKKAGAKGHFEKAKELAPTTYIAKKAELFL